MIPEIRDKLIIPINTYMHVPVIQSNQDAEPPEEDHIIYTFTSTFIPAGGIAYREYDRENATVTHQEPFDFVVSFTAVSYDEDSAAILCMQLRKWFAFYGDDVLDESGFVVDNITDIIPRDSFDEDEKRQGFDVRIATNESTTVNYDWFDTVQIGGTENGNQ